MSKWKSVKNPPKESGQYLVMCHTGTMAVLEYSAKHNLFNANDEFDREFAEAYSIPVEYWHELPELPKGVR